MKLPQPGTVLCVLSVACSTTDMVLSEFSDPVRSGLGGKPFCLSSHTSSSTTNSPLACITRRQRPSARKSLLRGQPRMHSEEAYTRKGRKHRLCSARCSTDCHYITQLNNQTEQTDSIGSEFCRATHMGSSPAALPQHTT